MAVLVPAIQADHATIAAIKRQLALDLMSMVKDANGGIDVVYRPLRPTDLNNGTTLGRTVSGSLTGGTVATDIFSTWTNLTAVQAVGIYGYAALSANPLIDEIQFVVGAGGGSQTLAIVELDEMYALQESVGYFVPPICWQPNEHLGIALLAGTSVTNEPISLMGYIAEPAGKTVVRPRTLVTRGGAPAIPGMI